MNRVLLFVFCWLCCWGFGQELSAEKRWKEINKGVEYVPSSRKTRPDRNSVEPYSLDDYYSDEEGYTTPAEYLNDEEIIYNREVQFGPYTGKGGIQKNDGASTIKKAPKIELEPVEIEPRDVDTPNIEPPRLDISENLWVIVFVLLVILILIGLIYYFFMRNVETNEKVSSDLTETEDWNPEVVTKSELELLLEKSIAEENYRQCVRIYYTFILQSLIKRGWIKWKQDKTNIHYQIEMVQRPVAREFGRIVQLYELVWYGNYEINQVVYQQLEPELKMLYKNIDTNEGK